MVSMLNKKHHKTDRGTEATCGQRQGERGARGGERVGTAGGAVNAARQVPAFLEREDAVDPLLLGEEHGKVYHSAATTGEGN